jgi:hypothetical protein
MGVIFARRITVNEFVTGKRLSEFVRAKCGSEFAIR